MRGLKLFLKLEDRNIHDVASFMDAWIEIPYGYKFDKNFKSHPLWMRGLKFIRRQDDVENGESHPLWMRGLK